MLPLVYHLAPTPDALKHCTVSRRYAEDGRPYYVDHNTQTTHWQHPGQLGRLSGPPSRSVDLNSDADSSAGGTQARGSCVAVSPCPVVRFVLVIYHSMIVRLVRAVSCKVAQRVCSHRDLSTRDTHAVVRTPWIAPLLRVLVAASEVKRDW